MDVPYAIRCAAAVLGAAPARAMTPPSTPNGSRAATPTPRARTPTRAATAASGAPGSPLSRSSVFDDERRAVVVRIHAAPAPTTPCLGSDAASAEDAASAGKAAEQVLKLFATKDGSIPVSNLSIVISIARPKDAAADVPASLPVRVGECARAIIARVALAVSKMCVTRIAATGCSLNGTTACGFLTRVLKVTETLVQRGPHALLGVLDLRSNALSVADLSKLMRLLSACRLELFPFAELLLADNPGAQNPAGCRVCQLLLEQIAEATSVAATPPTIDIVDEFEAASDALATTRPSAGRDVSPTADRAAELTPLGGPSLATSAVPSRLQSTSRGCSTDRQPSVVSSAPEANEEPPAPLPLAAVAAKKRGAGSEGLNYSSTTNKKMTSIDVDALALLQRGDGVAVGALERQHMILSEQWHRGFVLELERCKTVVKATAGLAWSLADHAATHQAVLRRMCAAHPLKPGQPAALSASSASASAAAGGGGLDRASQRLVDEVEALLRQGSADAGETAATAVREAHTRFVRRDAALSVRRADFLLAAHDHFCVTGELLTLAALAAGGHAKAAMQAVLPPDETPTRVSGRADASVSMTPPVLRHRSLGVSSGTSTAAAAALPSHHPGGDSGPSSASHRASKSAAQQREQRELNGLWIVLRDAHAEWVASASSDDGSCTVPGPTGALPVFGLRLRCELLKGLVHFRGLLAKHEAVLAAIAARLHTFGVLFAQFESRQRRLTALNASHQQQHSRHAASRSSSAAAASSHQPGHGRGGIAAHETAEEVAKPRSTVPVKATTPVRPRTTVSTAMRRTLSRTNSNATVGSTTPQRSHGAACAHRGAAAPDSTSNTAAHQQHSLTTADEAVAEAEDERRQKEAVAAAARRALEAKRKDAERKEREEEERKRDAHAYARRCTTRKEPAVTATTAAAAAKQRHHSADAPPHHAPYGASPIAATRHSGEYCDVTSIGGVSVSPESARGTSHARCLAAEWDTDERADASREQPAASSNHYGAPAVGGRGDALKLQHAAPPPAEAPAFGKLAVPDTRPCNRRPVASPRRLAGSPSHRDAPRSTPAMPLPSAEPHLSEPVRQDATGAASALHSKCGPPLKDTADPRAHEFSLHQHQPPAAQIRAAPDAEGRVALGLAKHAINRAEPVAAAQKRTPVVTPAPVVLSAPPRPSVTDELLARLRASDPGLFQSVSEHLARNHTTIQARVQERMDGLCASLHLPRSPYSSRSASASGAGPVQQQQATSRPAAPASLQWC